MKLQIRYPQLGPDYAREAYRFLTQNPVKPVFPAKQIERFITRLVSSDRNVAEIWGDEEKIVAGVLIDLVTNPHGSSHIEFLGFWKERPVSFESLQLMFQTFEEKVLKRKVHQGVIVGYHASLPFPEKYIRDLGYEFFYQMYELRLSEIRDNPIELRNSWSLHQLDLESFDEYYELLKSSFSQNPDTSVGAADDIRAGFVKAVIPTFAVRDAGTMIGFVNLHLDAETKQGEINTIGVDLPHRGRGVGKYLLGFGVQRLKELGAETVILSVAVANQQALSLYLNAGFQIEDEYSAFRKDLTTRSFL